jgi:hypothetical protein
MRNCEGGWAGGEIVGEIEDILILAGDVLMGGLKAGWADPLAVIWTTLGVNRKIFSPKRS